MTDLEGTVGNDCAGSDLSSKTGTSLIKAYRFLSYPIYKATGLTNLCTFTPSCSHYTEEAISMFGLMKGSAMGAYRILRCNPFTKGGDDPVLKY